MYVINELNIPQELRHEAETGRLSYLAREISQAYLRNAHGVGLRDVSFHLESRDSAGVPGELCTTLAIHISEGTRADFDSLSRKLGEMLLEEGVREQIQVRLMEVREVDLEGRRLVGQWRAG